MTKPTSIKPTINRFTAEEMVTAATLTGYRPKSPAGRNASVRSRKPNATAGAHDGP